MSSKASRILGIEDGGKPPSRSSTHPPPRSSRSLFGSSNNKKQKRSTSPAVPRSGLKTTRSALHDDLSDSDSELDYHLKRRPTDFERRSQRILSERDAFRSADGHRGSRSASVSSHRSDRSVSSFVSAHSDKANQLLGTSKGDSPPPRKHSRNSALSVDVTKKELPDLPAPTLPQLGTPSNEASFTDTVLHELPGTYPLPTTPPSAPSPPATRKTRAALAQTRHSTATTAPTPAPKSPLPFTPSTGARTSLRSPLAPLKPSTLNTFITGSHIYTHGPYPLKTTCSSLDTWTRRSASIKTLAGWGWEDNLDAEASYLFAHSEELTAEGTAAYFDACFNGVRKGENDEVVDEIWSKEWLAAPVLDVGLILSTARRMRDVDVDGGGGDVYPGQQGVGGGHRRTGSGLSGSVRFSGVRSPGKSPGSGAMGPFSTTSGTGSTRFSAVSGRPISVLSARSGSGGAGTGDGQSPVRKSWEKKGGFGYGAKAQDGLKELWFRRGLF